MKYFKFLLPLLFLACGSPDKQEEREMAFSAAAPAPVIDSTKITPNGDTIIYRHTVVTGSYSYDLPSVEVRLKGAVIPPVNLPPTAIAGPDATITLPVSTVKLDASASTDPEGQALKFFWRQTAGPTKATLTDTLKPICTASNLKEGTYTFEVRAVDPLNAFMPDFITITVKSEVVTPPVGSITPFSFQKNTAFKPRKFSGTEDWNGQYYTSFTGGAQDKYFRYCWTDIEKETQGNYVWTRFDQEFQKAINLKGKFSFGIMTVCDSDDFLAQEFFNGTSSRYPKYVHDRMQSESAKDFVRNGQWIPNWNSTFFLDRFDALLKAIQAHIVSKGWQDKVNYVDIRGYGQWGEWHSVSIVNQMSEYPSGTRPTVATYKRFINGHIAAFPDYPLVMLLATLDPNRLGHTQTPLEIVDFALKARNSWGLLGIRRDQWGATDGYVHDYLENNNGSYNGGPAFKNIIVERWKYAPWVGEPMGPGSNLSDLPRQVTFYHAASVGNGNYTADGTSQGYFRTAENNAGYKIAFTSGQAEVRTTGDFLITLNLENFGNTPCYENYDITYQLKNSSGTVVWTSSSSWHPILKLPGAHSFSDTFRPNVSGTYSLVMTVKNSYRSMPLFNNGQAADGSMVLGSIKF